MAHLSAIFATVVDSREYQFHRWTSKAAFHVDTGWHHIAIEYRYGEPESMRGWIDGTPTDGVWDRGGKTTKQPVQDDDEVWIGSSLGGNPGNSFHGYLDAVAVHRTVFPQDVMVARFNRLGGPRTIEPQPEVMPELANVYPDKVSITLAEGMPSHERWLNDGERWPESTLRWSGDCFLLPRIPLRYSDGGIRSGWKAPLLLRMAADVVLPPGEQRLMLRARGLGRLWVDGKVVARTDAFPRLRADGQHPITPLAKPPHPGLRNPRPPDAGSLWYGIRARAGWGRLQTFPNCRRDRGGWLRSPRGDGRDRGSVGDCWGHLLRSVAARGVQGGSTRLDGLCGRTGTRVY